MRDLSVRGEVVEISAIGLALVLVCLVWPLVIKTFPNSSFAQYDQWIMGSVVNCALVLNSRMGINQLIVAVIGCVVAFVIVYFLYNKKRNYCKN